QLLADRQHVGTEIVDRLLLLIGERGARPAARILQLLDLVLRVLELGLQVLLFRLVARIRGALNVVDQGEGPRRSAATAQRDEIVTAGQRVERVGDEIAVIRDRYDDCLAEEILALLPEAILEDIGIGDDDHIDRLGRGLDLRRTRRRGRTGGLRIRRLGGAVFFIARRFVVFLLVFWRTI